MTKSPGFMIIELVAALAITSILGIFVLLALVQFEESEVRQDVEVGVQGQLRYQTEILRGLPLPTLENIFASSSVSNRMDAADQKLYGSLNPPSRLATVTWQLQTVATDPDTGETLLGITATVSAPLALSGGITITQQATVYRALE